MKIRILLLSFMLASALFVINGICVDWDNPGTQSVDQMFGPETGASNLSQGEYSSPSAARAAESTQKGKEILNVPMGGKLNTDSNTPQGTRTNDSLSQESQAENTTTNTSSSAPVTTSTTTSPASVSGSWSLALSDSSSHSAVITLFQSGDAIYGTGNINMDENTTLVAAASGTLSGKDLNLDLITLGKVKLFRLEMSANDDLSEATGNYTAYSPSTSPSMGTVSGTRSAVAS